MQGGASTINECAKWLIIVDINNGSPLILNHCYNNARVVAIYRVPN